MERAELIIANKAHYWLYDLCLFETAYMFNKIGLDTITTYDMKLKEIPNFLR